MRIAIVGTGTDVGKTHVTQCLLASARARGLRAVAYKPVATGVDDLSSDAQAHAAAAGTPYVHPTFAYRRPVSPHMAAREEARPIEVHRIRTRADELAVGADAVLVEAAGGLFSPLSPIRTNVSLIEHLAPGLVVLVAPDRLGVLHDVTACAMAARASSVRISALVLSAPPTPDASSGTNAGELDLLGFGPVVSVFPRAPFDHAASLAAAARVWNVLVAAASR